MIAKNIKGKSFGGCVRYVMNEECELLEAEGVFAEKYPDNHPQFRHAESQPKRNKTTRRAYPDVIRTRR